MFENKITKLTVFCGSKYGNNPLFKESAVRLGKILAESNITLVFGGGRFGMMGAIAKAVVENGGNILPFSTPITWNRESNSAFVSELTGEVFDYSAFAKPVFLENIALRKSALIEQGDAICVLSGSVGTFEELLEAICLLRLGQIKKRIVIVDLLNYWAGFKIMMDSALKFGFADSNLWENICFVNSVDDVLPQILK